jgi:hypothetical protein
MPPADRLLQKEAKKPNPWRGLRLEGEKKQSQIG